MDKRIDKQNYDPQGRTNIAASRGKKCLQLSIFHQPSHGKVHRWRDSCYLNHQSDYNSINKSLTFYDCNSVNILH